MLLQSIEELNNIGFIYNVEYILAHIMLMLQSNIRF